MPEKKELWIKPKIKNVLKAYKEKSVTLKGSFLTSTLLVVTTSSYFTYTKFTALRNVAL